MGRKSMMRRLMPRTLWGDSNLRAILVSEKARAIPRSHAKRFRNDFLFRLETSGLGYDPLVQFVTDKEHAKLYIAAISGREVDHRDTQYACDQRTEVEAYGAKRIPM